MVGTGRFELPTPRTPSECSTRLSHVPTERIRGGDRPRMGLTQEFYHQRGFLPPPNVVIIPRQRAFKGSFGYKSSVLLRHERSKIIRGGTLPCRHQWTSTTTHTQTTVLTCTVRCESKPMARTSAKRVGSR